MAILNHIEDNSQQTHYFNNSVVKPVSTFQYDALYRLIHATGREFIEATMPGYNDFTNGLPVPFDGSALVNYTEHYNYDQLGNILALNHDSDGGQNWNRDYFYNEDNNRLLGHEEGVQLYDYDDHGNTTHMPHLERIKWDYADRMQYASLGGGGEVWYVYDASGERVRKVIENRNIKEERLYLGGYEIYTKTNNGEIEVERETLHVYDGDKRIAIIDSEPAKSGGSTGTTTGDEEPENGEITHHHPLPVR